LILLSCRGSSRYRVLQYTLYEAYISDLGYPIFPHSLIWQYRCHTSQNYQLLTIFALSQHGIRSNAPFLPWRIGGWFTYPPPVHANDLDIFWRNNCCFDQNFANFSSDDLCPKNCLGSYIGLRYCYTIMRVVLMPLCILLLFVDTFCSRVLIFNTIDKVIGLQAMSRQQ